MARNDGGRYEATYAKLLRLYPRSYQQRFAQPMQQMFADMVDEQRRHGQATRGFVYKIYAETFAGAVVEHMQEVVMNIKSTKSKVIIITGVALITAAVAVVLLNNRPTAQSIQPGTFLKQVRELSKGDKSNCLANVPSVAEAVKRDDGFVEFEETKLSKFEMVAGGAIADVPAGTGYSQTINSYADDTVKGALIYEKDYGTYNYTTKKLAKAGEWQLMSVVACKK